MGVSSSIVPAMGAASGYAVGPQPVLGSFRTGLDSTTVYDTNDGRQRRSLAWSVPVLRRLHLTVHSFLIICIPSNEHLIRSMIPDYREAPVTRCSGSTISAMQCTAQLLPAPSQPLHKGLTRSTPEFLSDSDAAALAQHSPARSVVMPRRQRPPLYADCTLLPAKEGSSPIRADTLWAERPVCFLLIRRPGCGAPARHWPACRAIACLLA